jgi:hypothetical protein
VQYGDWPGTAAADDIDPSSASVRRYLREKGLVKPNEFLIAVQLFVGETHHNNQLAKPYIRAFLLEGADNYEDVKKRLEELESAGEPIPVREVNIDMHLEAFVGMFKPLCGHADLARPSVNGSRIHSHRRGLMKVIVLENRTKGAAHIISSSKETYQRRSQGTM